MEFFHDQTSKALLLPNLKHNKKRLTEEQVRLLERSFTTSKKLEPELKQNLANRLGVPPRQVAIWYQNKRARWKTQTLEVGYKALQVQLEHVTAEKKRLEREVKHLQAELKKAQEMLFCLTNQGQNVNPSVSCEEGGSSGAGGFNHGDSQLVDDELFHLCMFDWCK